ncbi:MAG: hypothetical protein ABII00_19335 [Elusimicrobiota bacterium]
MRDSRQRRRGDRLYRSAVEAPQSQPVEAEEQSLPELTPQPVEQPDIPELKKKEKERKGAGVPWYAGSGAGVSGARVGGSVAARSGLFGTGKIATTLSNFFGPTSALGGLFASKLGPILVFGGLLGWGGLMALAGLKLMGGGVAPAQVKVTAALPGVGSSGIIIDRARNKSLGLLTGANQGEIVWDKKHPQAPKDSPKDEPVEVEEEAPAEPEVPAFEMPDVSQVMGQRGLNREGFVKKLSKGTGQMGAGTGGRLKEGMSGFNLKKSFGSVKSNLKAPRKLQAFSRSKSSLGARKMSTLRGRSSRAMGQLKLARRMSTSGAATAADGQAKQFSADAFEQGATIGGSLDGVDQGSGIVMPPGSGAPSPSGSGSGTADEEPTVPEVGIGENVTPYQDQLDSAQDMGNMAAGLKKGAMAMIALGMALVAIGLIIMYSCGWTGIGMKIGLALVMSGTMMLAMGAAMLAMAGKMAGQAKDQGQQIEDEYGQEEQGDIVDECSDQAVADGTAPANCTPSTQPEVQKSNDVHTAVEEESNATYELAPEE